MFWPTRIRASSLSSVSSVGVDRMLALTWVSSARARNARLVIRPRPGIVIVPFVIPSARPCPTEPGFAEMSMMLLPLPRGWKLVPPMTRVCVELMPLSACHWMPNSAALSADTSQISASTNTCARRMSSFSMIARRLL